MNLFLDSMMHYNISQVNRKWLQVGGCVLTTVDGSPYLDFQATGQASMTLPPRSSIVIGFRMSCGQTATNGSIYRAAAINSARNEEAYLSFIILNDGTPALYAGNLDVIIGNDTSFIFHPNTKYYIEIKYSTSFSVSGVTGKRTVSAELRIDGTTRISGSAEADTPTTSWVTQPQGAVNIHHFITPTFGPLRIRDLYIFDQNGGVNDDFAGDSKIGVIYPRNNSVAADWDSNGAGSNYLCINEHAADDDATYISTLTPDDTWEGNFDEVTDEGSIIAAHLLVLARKDDEGTRSIGFKLSGADEGDPQYINDSYIYYRLPIDIHPGEDATIFNARTFGVKMLS